MDQNRHRSNTRIPLFHTSSLIYNISAIVCEHTGVKGARGRIMGVRRRPEFLSIFDCVCEYKGVYGLTGCCLFSLA